MNEVHEDKSMSDTYTESSIDRPERAQNHIAKRKRLYIAEWDYFTISSIDEETRRKFRRCKASFIINSAADTR